MRSLAFCLLAAGALLAANEPTPHAIRIDPKGFEASEQDIAKVCRSAATASEFLYTVNAFADLRRRVVIAADRAPQALEGLGADVKSRLAGGLCVGLDKPDRDTRLAILKSRAVEFTRSVYRGDRYDFVTELNEIG